jgi:hypothetical protein
MDGRHMCQHDATHIVPPGSVVLGLGGALDPTFSLWRAAGGLGLDEPPWPRAGRAEEPWFWSVDYAPSCEALVDRLLEGGQVLHLHAGRQAPAPCCSHYRWIWRRRWRLSHLTLRATTAGRFPDEIRDPLREATREAERGGWAPPLRVGWDVALIELRAVFGERSEGREATLRFAFSPFAGELFARYALPHMSWSLAGVVTTRQSFAHTRSYGLGLASRELGRLLMENAPACAHPLLLAGDQGVRDYPGRVSPTCRTLPGWGYSGVHVYRWEPGRSGSSMTSSTSSLMIMCRPPLQ